MRAKIKVQRIGNKSLTFDYQYYLASMLYKKLALANIKLANDLHSTDDFKFYTFSNLIFEDRKFNRRGLDFNNAYLFLSSPDKEFIRSFAEGLLQSPDLNLDRTKLIVKQIEILPEFKPEKDKYMLSTLSTIYIKTLREDKGKLTEWDIYPKDGKWHENLHLNLLARYEEFYGYPPAEDFFEVLKVKSFKGKRIRIAGNYRRCSLLDFEVQASPVLIKFAYDACLGEKNAMGFGCVEVEEIVSTNSTQNAFKVG